MADWILQHGESVQYLLFFSILPTMVIVERLVPFRVGAARGARLRTNVALTVFAILGLGLIPVSFIGTALWAQSAGFGLLNRVPMPEVAVVVATLVLRGGLSTFTHWLNHRIPLLWRFHRVHHLDTDLDVSSTVRFHPLEMPVNALIGVPLVALFGLSPWVLAVYELLDIVVTLFSHSNLRVPEHVNRWLRYLIVTPNLHRVHHSLHREETDSNYGAVFPFWDVVFCTFRTQTREPQREMTLGLHEVRGADAHRLGTLLLSPLYGDLARMCRPQQDETGPANPGKAAL